jgi:hypothetical protein
MRRAGKRGAPNLLAGGQPIPRRNRFLEHQLLQRFNK